MPFNAMRIELSLHEHGPKKLTTHWNQTQVLKSSRFIAIRVSLEISDHGHSVYLKNSGKEQQIKKLTIQIIWQSTTFKLDFVSKYIVIPLNGCLKKKTHTYFAFAKRSFSFRKKTALYIPAFSKRQLDFPFEYEQKFSARLIVT